MPRPSSTPLSEMRRRRLDLGLTQAGVAARAGVSLAYLSVVEREPGLLRPGFAEKVAPVLKCRAADLLPKTE